ncbi:GNAT family N-acetyltransferase [Saccharibacillus sp. CPCC 101409]|uniref:GNAT family N-acetyltransferase n=1 Tax=Saccharibacillus sp. CPCC 101409 TaxID=3058041 RepID=UPI002670F0D3|nr:GNAT family N-acetyltransferase [Saccharibacillus sp. CPCC 101409]MDO3410768.1 GNAT family N-acetyltransferase [Saccharibacillus sp. CPCC 101409]
MFERLGAEAWPSLASEPLGGWRLRAAGGISKRANSVWTAAPYPDEDRDWLQSAEDFAERHGIPCCFYVSDTSPAGLDERLEAAGYALSDPCFLMTGEAEEVRRLAEARRALYPTQAELLSEAVHGEPRSVIGGERSGRLPCGEEPVAAPDGSWLADFLALEGFPPERAPGYAAIFGAIRQQKSLARLRIGGRTAALGTAMLGEGRACLSNIVVAPEFRRMGLAAELIGLLAQRSLQSGAEELYLQVVQSNATAIRLYESLGFGVLARHHYRTRPTDGDMPRTSRFKPEI